jgi:hypothetical protein
MKKVTIGSLKISQLRDADKLHLSHELAAQVTIKSGRGEYTLLTKSNKTSFPIPVKRVSSDVVGMGFTMRVLTEIKSGESVSLSKLTIESNGSIGIIRRIDSGIEFLLRKFLGAPVSVFRTAMGFPGDDNRALVRLENSQFSRLGISPGDQVFVEYAGKKISAFAFEQLDEIYSPSTVLKNSKAVGLKSSQLPKDFPQYLLVHVSPIARDALGIPKDNVTSIVRVHRRIRTRLASEFNKLLLPMAVFVLSILPAEISHWIKFFIYVIGTPLIILISLAPLKIRKATKGVWP